MGRMEMSVLSHKKDQSPWIVLKNENDPGSNPYPGGFAEISKINRPTPAKLFFNNVHTESMHEKNLHSNTLNSFESVRMANIVANNDRLAVKGDRSLQLSSAE